MAIATDWLQVRLGDILSERKEKPDQNAVLTGEIPIIAKIQFDTGTIKLRRSTETRTSMILIQPGDLVVSGINATKGAIGIYKEENSRPAAATIHYSAYSIDRKRIDIRYLWHYLRSASFRNTMLMSLPKGIKTEVKPRRFLALSVCIPTRVEEQKRIAASLDQQLSRISESKELECQVVNEIDFLRNSVVSSLCYDKKYPLVDFQDILLEAKNGIYKPAQFWGRGLPCIRMYNIDGPEMNEINLKRLEVDSDELEKYLCKPGDLIFNRINSVELVGKTGIIPPNYPLSTFEAMNIRLRVDLRKVLPEFAAIVLNSVETRRYYRSNLKKQCGMATLNHKHIKLIPFPLPTLEEQKTMVDRISALKVRLSEVKQLAEQVVYEMDRLIMAIVEGHFQKSCSSARNVSPTHHVS